MEKPNFKEICKMYIQQLTNFPYIEKDFDALTDYQLLCKIVEYLNKVIANEKEQNELLTELYNAFNTLKDYVDNYFDNLDVQDEINNKLDEMLEDGVLEQIIEQFLQLTSLICFDNVADMKLSTNLANGSYARTLGYHSVNDDGGAYYKIRQIKNDDVVDEKFIIAVYDDNLIAELITNNLNIKQLGAYGDNTHDDTSYFIAFSNSNIKKLTIPYGEYVINDVLNFENKELIGIGKPILKLETQATSREHYIILNGYARIENISFYNNIWSTKTMALKNCNDVVIKNCYSKLGDNLKSGGLLDLYTNNKNILIENCIFDFKSYSDGTHGTAGNGNGGIWIREQDSSKTSENITMENCYISHYSGDEALGVWMWNGIVRNVQINNCIIEGKENNPSTHFITLSTLDSSMNNCHIINKPGVQKGSIIHRGDISVQPVTINNCIIDIDETFGNSIVNHPKAIVNNCKIINQQTTTFEGAKFIGCTIDTAGFKLNDAYLKDCVINNINNYVMSTNGSIRYGVDLENCTFNNLAYSCDSLIQNFVDNNSYKIINCYFYGDFSGLTRLISSSKITDLQVINSLIPKVSANLSREDNTGIFANNLIGTGIGYMGGVKTNNNFNYNN